MFLFKLVNTFILFCLILFLQSCATQAAVRSYFLSENQQPHLKTEKTDSVNSIVKQQKVLPLLQEQKVLVR